MHESANVTLIWEEQRRYSCKKYALNVATYKSSMTTRYQEMSQNCLTGCWLPLCDLSPVEELSWWTTRWQQSKEYWGISTWSKLTLSCLYVANSRQPYLLQGTEMPWVLPCQFVPNQGSTIHIHVHVPSFYNRLSRGVSGTHIVNENILFPTLCHLPGLNSGDSHQTSFGRTIC